MKIRWCRVVLLSVVSITTAMICHPTQLLAENFLPDRVRVRMSQIDDVGLIVLWNQQGTSTIAKCVWSGGHEGFEDIELTRHLQQGDNYIVFILYNSVYTPGGRLFPGLGKWKFNVKFFLNDEVLWRDSDLSYDNTPGIKYWHPIRLQLEKTGRIRSLPIPEDIRERIKKRLPKLEAELTADHTTAQDR